MPCFFNMHYCIENVRKIYKCRGVTNYRTMTISTITSKGQTTIPKKVRQYLDLQPQQQIAFEPKDGYVIIRPVDTSLEHFAGILSGKQPAGSKADERKVVARMLGEAGENQ